VALNIFVSSAHTQKLRPIVVKTAEMTEANRFSGFLLFTMHLEKSSPDLLVTPVAVDVHPHRHAVELRDHITEHAWHKLLLHNVFFSGAST
jgi:hypothetical protein